MQVISHGLSNKENVTTNCNDNVGNVDSFSNDETWQSLVENLRYELTVTLNDGIANIDETSVATRNEMYHNYLKQMIKTNTKVKKMKLSEFRTANGVSLLDYATKIKALCASTCNDSSTTNSNQDMSTAFRPKYETPSRRVKRGEILYSKNGSPIEDVDNNDVTATVRKKPNGQLELDLAGGKLIDAASLQNLGSSDKNSAMAEILDLKEQLDSMLQQLQQSSV